jgi:hypothetical protein
LKNQKTISPSNSYLFEVNIMGKYVPTEAASHDLKSKHTSLGILLNKARKTIKDS